MSNGYGPPQVGLTQGRIDAGVDYSGTGTVNAIADAVITFLGYESSNRAGGAGPFLIYKTADGRYVYVAEQWTPRVAKGQRVSRGQVLGQVSGGHIEEGWAGGPTGVWNTLSGARGEPQTDTTGKPTPSGQDFAAAVGGAGGAQTMSAAGTSAGVGGCGTVLALQASLIGGGCWAIFHFLF